MAHAITLYTNDFVSRCLNLLCIKAHSSRGRELAYFITPLSDTEKHRCRGIWQPVKNRVASEWGGHKKSKFFYHRDAVLFQNNVAQMSI